MSDIFGPINKILQSLPVTTDGRTIYPGMVVYIQSRGHISQTTVTAVNHRKLIQLQDSPDDWYDPDRMSIYANKLITFALSYGQDPTNLAAKLNITSVEAKTLIDKFYKSFPAINDYKNKMIDDDKEMESVQIQESN